MSKGKKGEQRDKMKCQKAKKGAIRSNEMLKSKKGSNEINWNIRIQKKEAMRSNPNILQHNPHKLS